VGTSTSHNPVGLLVVLQGQLHLLPLTTIVFLNDNHIVFVTEMHYAFSEKGTKIVNIIYMIYPFKESNIAETM
jgi:hypothetical protein